MHAPSPRLTCMLFDLDGTLVDSAPGITRCLAATIMHFGGPRLRPETLTEFVGPPVADTLRALTPVPESHLPDVVAHYRAGYLDHGLAESAPFPGVLELLATLSDRGVPLAVVGPIGAGRPNC